jgi:hypothetical protein
MTTNLPTERADVTGQPVGPGMVGVPILPWMWAEAVGSLLQLQQELPPGSRLELIGGASSIAAKRNGIVETFLRDPKLEWLWFVDSDMTIPRGSFGRLWNHHLDVVSGLYVRRSPPFGLVLERLEGAPAEFQAGGLEPASMFGCGCLLVRRSVFERVPPPWFEHPRPGEGEDWYFCEKAKRAGIELWCDTGVQPGHLGVTAVDLAFATQWWQAEAAFVQLQAGTAPPRSERVVVEKGTDRRPLPSTPTHAFDGGSRG